MANKIDNIEYEQIELLSIRVICRDNNVIIIYLYIKQIYKQFILYVQAPISCNVIINNNNNNIFWCNKKKGFIKGDLNKNK